MELTYVAYLILVYGSTGAVTWTTDQNIDFRHLSIENETQKL